MFWRAFLSSDSGAVAVDWIILTASVVAASGLVTNFIHNGLAELSYSITDELHAEQAVFAPEAEQATPQHHQAPVEDGAISLPEMASQEYNEDSVGPAPSRIAMIYSGSIWAVRYRERWADCPNLSATKGFVYQAATARACLSSPQLRGVRF